MLQPSDVFLAELYFIDHVSDAIPGGLEPRMPTLMLAGERLTPLLPLNPLLLDYFTPEDLCDRVHFRRIGSESIEVSLDLSQSALANQSSGSKLSQTYALKSENAFDGVPVLEVWPNLRSPNWREYYVFYYDAGLGKDTFQIELGRVEQTNQEVHTFKDNSGGIFRMFRLEEFPTVIRCHNEANQTVGIILPKQPPQLQCHKSWKVGIDLGSGWTNIYIQRKPGVEEPLPLDNLLRKLTASSLGTRFPVLLNYFIPEEFLPSDHPLPIQNVVTTRGGDRTRKRAIFDGRIYIPNLKQFDPKQEWVETDIRVDGNPIGCGDCKLVCVKGQKLDRMNYSV